MKPGEDLCSVNDITVLRRIIYGLFGVSKKTFQEGDSALLHKKRAYSNQSRATEYD